MDLEDMVPLEHRGATYYADDEERIFNADGKLLGYISSRGSQYIWGALEGEDEHEFASGTGVWHPSTAGSDDDPALEGILRAHAERDQAR